MQKLVPLIWAGLTVCIAAPSTGGAQTSAPAVSVRSVKFNYPRIDGAKSFAMEVEIELDVPGTTEPGHNPRFVDAVRVALMLGVQARGHEGGDLQYYYADAGFVTLETGTRFARFYLPPEIVKRDGLAGDAFAYCVELAVDGRELPMQRADLSETLRSRDRLEAFRQRVAEARSVTHGILVEQHQFMTGLSDRRETSSVVRKTGL